MERPDEEISGCRRAHERMADVLAGMTDTVAAGPSLLPQWTVGHVVTHLARNAEAMHRRVEGAVRDELIEQYAGGAAGRAAEIDAGAARPAAELIDDAMRWSTRLDDLFASLQDETWARPVRTVGGDQHPVSMLPFRRWREVEVHLVDLNLGFNAADWSQGLIDRALPRLLGGLTRRADGRELAAWLLGRGSPPRLSPWA